MTLNWHASEFYRRLYEEKVMPFLRLEKPTATESERQIEKLRQQFQRKTEQIKTLETKIAKLEPLAELLDKGNPENLKLFVKAWLETEDFNKEYKAKEKKQPYKKIIQLELTEEQIDKLTSASNSVSIDLAKALRKALNLTIEDFDKE